MIVATQNVLWHVEMTTITISTEGIKLRKPVETLVMVPRTNKLSALARKMYNVMLYVSQREMLSMTTIPSATYMFAAPLVEILTISGAKNQNESGKKYLTEMRKAEVVWDSPDSNAELQHVGFNLLSEVRLSLKGGMIWAHWSLPPSLYESLADPERWGTVDLRMLSRLNTYASVALYEITSKYKDNPSKLTCRKPPEWWMEALIASPAAIDPETGKRKLPDWRKFKNKTLGPAIDANNNETDLLIELIEERMYGKAVTSVQFKVTKKRSVKLVQPGKDDGDSISQEVLGFADRLGIHDKSAITGMTKNHGEQAVIDALRKLDDRMKQQHLPLVKRPASYLKFLLSDDAAEDTGQDVVEREDNEELRDSHVNTAIQQEVELSEMERQEAMLRQKRELIEERLKSMNAEEQQRWIGAYTKYLEAKGQLTLSIKRRLAQPDWLVGAVRAGMIEFYAQTEYGADWKKRPGLVE